ncbi:asparagine synthase-related protein [Sporolactobacillus laevolacticus]|uniref:asparagine synthase-related protein n=1 Tax=Sporolactobacillus laevolacticus TaxID=33018 RepID=UPI0025B37B66|nr:asparagine synthase-related protein [Sporolactobacillus laevolacticus]MDN3954787.1 asparagine synthase-related protein [Sporolactobacillus laevolacticus]
MSAISGIVDFEGSPIIADQGAKMMAALANSSADYVSSWHDTHVSFGCRNQWFTPEATNECLPIFDNRSGLAITADAIIDNRDELFASLNISSADQERVGDGALILLAYEKWREETPKHLVGDFAFMIWDSKAHVLFGARDFSGNRMFYYSEIERQFAFGSTIESILALPNASRKMNEDWLAQFLVIPDTTDCADTNLTVYQSINQVPPAYSILVKNGHVTLRRYCLISDQEPLHFKSDSEYVEGFKEVFERAVSDRIRSHRGVGAFLSGGLDSGSVAAYASRLMRNSGDKLQTFSYIPETDFTDWTSRYYIPNERAQVEMIAEHCKNVQTHFLDFKGQSPFSEIDHCLAIMEMPYKFFENLYWIKGVFEEAQKHKLGVLLNGARGNFTISWGPALDYYASLLKSCHWFHLMKEVKQYSRNIGVGRRRVLSVVGEKAFPIVGHLMPLHSDSIPTLINDQFARKTNVYQQVEELGYDLSGKLLMSGFAYRQHHFKQNYSWTPTGTCYGKLSLRYGVKDRDPSNDLRVIRYCLSVPSEQVVRNGIDRALIRRSTENLLPDSIRLNQRSRGIQGADIIHRMAPHWNEWLVELHKMKGDSLITDLINHETIDQGIKEMEKGPQPDFAFNFHFKVLMRALVLYRFLVKSAVSC